MQLITPCGYHSYPQNLETTNVGDGELAWGLEIQGYMEGAEGRKGKGKMMKIQF